MKINKEQAAIMQLCDSIELFRKKRFIAAITLAAASEEILAQLLHQHSKQTNIPHLTEEETVTGMFDMFKDFLGVKNYHRYRNKIKNELKHHGNEKNKNIISGNFRQIALNHISGSIINYKMRRNALPEDIIVKDFCRDIGIS